MAGLAVQGGRIVAATRVGVLRSVDTGRTWQVPDNHALALAEAVAFTPDGTLFAAAADGLYRSVDAGSSWSQVLGATRVLSLAVGSAAELVLVGTDSDGLVRSDDGGRIWDAANAGLSDPTVLAVALSPTFENDGIGFAGTPSGIFRTRNAARAWRFVDTGFGEVAVQSIAVSPVFGVDRVVLAGTESNGLFRSADGGTTWQVMPDLADRSIAALAFSPSPSNLVAAATDDAVAVSGDVGCTWRLSAPLAAAPVLALSFADDVLLAGLAREGVARSTDAGRTWAPSNSGMYARFHVALAISPDATVHVADAEDGGFGLAVHGQTLYASRADGLYRSQDAGASWQRRYAGDLSLRALACAANGELVAGVEGGGLAASHDGGETWTPLNSPVGEVLSVSMAYDAALWVVTRGAGWRSNNGGQEWHRLTGLPTDISSLAIAGERAVLAGTSRGVFVSRDGGHHFTLEDSGPSSVIALALSPESQRVLALGLGGRIWSRALSL